MVTISQHKQPQHIDLENSPRRVSYEPSMKIQKSRNQTSSGVSSSSVTSSQSSVASNSKIIKAKESKKTPSQVSKISKLRESFQSLIKPVINSQK